MCEAKNICHRKGDDYSTWMEFGNLFGLYWGVFFFAAYGEMVLAGVFSQVKWVATANPYFKFLIQKLYVVTAFYLAEGNNVTY